MNCSFSPDRTAAIDHRYGRSRRSPAGPAAPNGAAFPFTTPAWCRYTIVPGPGRVLAYLDFSGMEFGVAAALSCCDTMLADYAAEPYLVLPIRLGLMPPDATKATHSVERDRYKPLIIAMQCGGGEELVERRLELSKLNARRFVELHHQRYEDYWEYSDRRLQAAFESGELQTPDGWRTAVVSSTSIFTARNWLIQASSAAIFRYAGLLMRHLGVPVIAPVHDAVLIEAEVEHIDREIARAIECLRRASRRFLHGATLRVDIKRIAAGERFEEPRGARTWSFVERSLRELEKGLVDVA
jgi:DNA polymerase I-like protein with 3'-5' exonuclease and polymerase domains